jgi:hypothetical protein
MRLGKHEKLKRIVDEEARSAKAAKEGAHINDWTA